MVRCYFKNTLKLSIFVIFLYVTLCFIVSQNHRVQDSDISHKDRGVGAYKLKQNVSLLEKLQQAKYNVDQLDNKLANFSQMNKKNEDDAERFEEIPVLSGIRVLKQRGFSYKGLVIKEDETPAIAEQKYYKLISHLDVACDEWVRVGRKSDGGWNICTAGPYRPRPPCLVYSFGIGKDFSFDDEMASTYSCTVRAFDPSMSGFSPRRPSGVLFYNRGLAEQDGWRKKGWKMHTLPSLLKLFHEENATLDILKLDIEYSEWGALRTILKHKVLTKVKQLAFETHTHELRGGEASTVENFIEYSQVIFELRSQGFLLWTSHFNTAGGYWSARSGDHRTCCHELGFLNTNYLKGYRIVAEE